MTTLADSFLADLEDSGDEDEELLQQEVAKRAPQQTHVEVDAADQLMVDVDDIDAMEDGDEHGSDAKAAAAKASSTIASIVTLYQSERIQRHLELMNAVSTGLNSDVVGAIMESNELLIAIDAQLAAAFKYLVDLYSTRFPELERMVPQAAQYARVVQRLKNTEDVQSVDLSDIVPSENIMIIAMTASTTKTAPLSDESIANCLSACEVIIQLDEDMNKILEFVERRMNLIAPNVSVLCGSGVASRLIGMAGGIEQLSKIPACNIRVLGSKKALDLSGFSRTTTRPHEGILGSTEVVSSAPDHLRFKALRLLADKVALAARVDAFQSEPSDAKGRELLEDIEKRLEKLQEPPKRKEEKALPAPIEKAKKKRGGKRYRRMKERYEITDLQKQKNRMEFGKAEETSYDGLELGMIGASGSGRLKIVSKDTQKLAKAAARKLNKKRNYGSSGATSGLASSLAFTPVQGLELVNPEAQMATVKKANDRYFGENAGFKRPAALPSKKAKSS